MFFEGSEKKFELCMKPGRDSLRNKGRSYWEKLVESSKAQILSTLSNNKCDAYLLSESSLFVWDDQVTMITCGRTELVHAALSLVNEIGVDQLETFFFERKNEYYPQYQKTDFFDDWRLLSKAIPGEALRFGPADGHHLFLFHLNRPANLKSEDFTFEVLLYGLKGTCEDLFNSTNSSIERIRRETGIADIFEGFEVDDFLFDPCGYSLNALRGGEYYTVHVTPQEDGSYVSFETNVKVRNEVQPVISKLIEAFGPQSFDIVTFQNESGSPTPSVPGFQRKISASEKLASGFELRFSNDFRPNEQVISAYPLKPLSF